MNKKQQIEQMRTAIMNYADKYDWGLFKFECENLAIVLHNLGYRKIEDDCAVITKAELKQYKEQAVKEFSENLKERIKSLKVAEDENYIFKCGFDVLQENLPEIIDEAIKEREE